VKAALRALPLGVLVAFVAIAVVTRVRTRGTLPPVTQPATLSSSALPDAAPRGLDAPLRAELSPDADVRRAPPRMVHGATTHAHRGASRGPKTARAS